MIGVGDWWPGGQTSKVSMGIENNRLRANVAGGTDQVWDVLVEYTVFPLQAGRAYSLAFDAAVSGGTGIRVTVQYEYEPYTKALSRDITLGTSMRHFSFQFTSGFSTTRGVLTFQLGGRSARTFQLDNVSLH